MMTTSLLNDKTGQQIIEGIASRFAKLVRTKGLSGYSPLGSELGVALFLCSYSTTHTEYINISEIALKQILRNVRNNAPLISYCNGYAGLGIVLNKLKEIGYIEDITEALNHLDICIHNMFHKYLHTENIDFLHGKIGVGFYLIMRASEDCDYSKTLLINIIETIEKCSLKIGYKNIIQQFNPKDSNKNFNISLSHGMSGVLIFLCQLYKKRLLGKEMQEKIFDLIQNSTNFLITQRLDPTLNGSCFPSLSLINKTNGTYSRLAWCYGDLGIAMALLNASNILNNESVKEIACSTLAYNATHRLNAIDNLIYDGTMCHGSSGVAAIFRKISNLSDTHFYKEAWNYWHKVTLNFAKADNLGFRYDFYNPEKHKFQPDNSILTGTSGVGLYLLNSEIIENLFLIDTLDDAL